DAHCESASVEQAVRTRSTPSARSRRKGKDGITPASGRSAALAQKRGNIQIFSVKLPHRKINRLFPRCGDHVSRRDPGAGQTLGLSLETRGNYGNARFVLHFGAN